MAEDQSFHYSMPKNPPKGTKFITADQVEKILLEQLETHQHPEELVLWELVRLYSETGRHQDALGRMKQVLAIVKTPEEKASCYKGMGQLMEQMENFEAAIKYYSEAMALEPVNNETWYFIFNNLGYSLNQLKRHAEAETYCRQAIQIEPRRCNAYKNLGISLEGQGDYAGAANCYIKAVHENASDPRALKHLEMLAEKHPTVTIDVQEFGAQLEACQMAVKKAAEAWDLRVSERDSL